MIRRTPRSTRLSKLLSYMTALRTAGSSRCSFGIAVIARGWAASDRAAPSRFCQAVRASGLEQILARENAQDLMALAIDDRYAPSVRFAIRSATMPLRSEAHTSELQSLMRTSYAVFCLKKTRIPADNGHRSQMNTTYSSATI